MAVFRVNRTKDYTVMANFHLRDTSLSLKAKGLLSLMLSLPENWDYTTKGLASICKDGVDSISATVKELEKAGYIQRQRRRNAQGRLTDVEYTILEKPVPPETQEDSPKRENPILEKPVLENPRQENPGQDLPRQEKPILENPAQLNIQESITYQSNTDLSNTHSFCPDELREEAERQTDGIADIESIRKQIEYRILCERYRRDQLDELVDIMLEVMLNQSPTIRIGRDAQYPTGFVQERFRRINSLHIEKVMDGIEENRTHVRNTKAYLLASLFNSVSTLDHHYTMQYNADFGYNGSY